MWSHRGPVPQPKVSGKAAIFGYFAVETPVNTRDLLNQPNSVKYSAGIGLVFALGEGREGD